MALMNTSIWHCYYIEDTCTGVKLRSLNLYRYAMRWDGTGTQLPIR